MAYTIAVGSGYSLRFRSLGLPAVLEQNGTRVGHAERRVHVTDGLDDAGEFAIASAHDGGAANDTSVIVWAENGEAHGVLVDPAGSDHAPVLVHQYCTASPNASGERGWLWGVGAADVSSLKELRAGALPANSFGYLLVAPSAGTVTPPGSFGTLCLAGGVGRYVDQIRQADASGSRQFSVLPNAIPTPLGPHVTQWGETSNFQTWYRDTLGAQVESNFTSALSVAFE